MTVVVNHGGEHDKCQDTKQHGKGEHEVLVGHHTETVLIKGIRREAWVVELRLLLFDVMNLELLLGHAFVLLLITVVSFFNKGAGLSLFALLEEAKDGEHLLNRCILKLMTLLNESLCECDL